PGQKPWLESMKALKNAMSQTRDSLHFSEDDINHRRGHYQYVHSGVSYGGGQPLPMNLAHHNKSHLVDDLVENQDLIRIAHHVNTAFAMSAPKLYRHYEQLADSLLTYELEEALQRPYAKCAFMASTINLGDKVVTLRHKDHKNLPSGLCAVVSMGDYNHKLGGHLVLHELKLIMEFPPGYVIFLPSASITHSNIEISDDEWRSSITYYTAGGLFRWHAYGGRTEERLRTEDPQLWNRMKDGMEARWKEAIDLFSKYEELEDDIRKFFLP
ncbi:hypothetical protein EDB85DRAFT_1881571, partial [Lactarius pseudohatsudake]